MQDRINQVDEDLLHRTAGPYRWVRSGTDYQRESELVVRFAPKADSCTGELGSLLD